MALSTKKKNLIIAEWKAGKYPSYSAVSTAWGISRPTAKRLLGEIDKDNMSIVEAGVLYKTGLGVTKTLQELKAVEKLVEERISTLKSDNELVDNNRKIAKMLQSVIVKNKDDINVTNLRNVSGTIKDIESIANPSASKSDTQVNVQTNVQNNVAIEWE